MGAFVTSRIQEVHGERMINRSSARCATVFYPPTELTTTMRIQALSVENFRAIERFQVDALTDFVLIAGPNGCGKTTILDAIRLAKSAYVHNEWKKWFQEFGVNVDRPNNWQTLFRDTDKPIAISATFRLTEEERRFLAERADDIALAIAQNSLPDRDRRASNTVTGDQPVVPPTLPKTQADQLRGSAAELANSLRSALESSDEFVASVKLTAGPSLEVSPSPVATAAFTCFRPDTLGEVEFHTSRRSYARESVESVNLRLGSRSEERRNRFLYDLENKYKNIKTQLGEEYVASILRGADPTEAPLQKSIKELFQTFFPGKSFLGVQVAADNSLRFPVRLDSGQQHDIDELSSGEKEIVYGYLWLRTGTPRRSVILVDEPELHLNPALVQGLPTFYQRHLAQALDAQVWIVTHSDAILRQAVRAPNMTVLHMARNASDGLSQARQIDGQDAVEAAVLDLIGDIAAYRPYAKIVLVEGHRDTRFDVDMIRRLFPDFTERANLIPVGNRAMTTGVRVRLVEVLETSGIAERAVSISDGDLGLSGTPEQPGHFIWPAYEIENFLLEPAVIRAAACTLLRNDPFAEDGAVVAALRTVAAPLAEEMALDEVQYLLNKEFVSSISIGGSTRRPVQDLLRSAVATQQRLSAIDISEARVQALFEAAAVRIRATLDSGDFLSRLPGDRLLRALAGKLGVNSDHFRNVCLDQAQRLGWRPPGMEALLRDAIG